LFPGALFITITHWVHYPKGYMVKLLGICASPRAGGNSEALLDIALSAAAAEGVEAEKVTLAGKTVLGCIACLKCREAKDGLCHGRDDDLGELLPRVYAADGLLLASPVYFGAATAEAAAFIDRVGYVSRGNGGLLRRKVGAPVVVARRAGQNFTVAQLNYFFLINEMIVPGASYWPIAFGGARGEALGDDEGVRTVKNLAANVAWLIKLIAKSKI
jgi:multimeric flavodoxin WrbA